MRTKAPQTTTPLLEKIQPMGPKAWITRLLLDPSITSSYYEPDYQDTAGTTLLTNKKDQQHLSVASEDKEHDDLLSTHNEDDPEDVMARPFLPRIKAYLSYVAKKVFVETYEFDGLHLSNATYTAVDGIERDYPGDELPSSHIKATLLGAPNRPVGSWRGVETGLEFSIPSAINFFGGLFHPNIRERRRDGKQSSGLEIFAVILNLLFKLFVILPVKLAVLVPKILFIAIKFVTEYIPSFIKNVTGTLVGHLAKNLVLSYELSQLSILYPIGGFILFGFSFVIMSALHTAARTLTIVAAAFTSPLKSAKFAVALATAIRLSENNYLNYVAMFVMGAIFLAVSIALSTALWSIVFPLILTGLTTIFPALTGMINGLVATPLIASSLTAINTAIASAWSSLGLTAAFAYAANAIALHFGIQIAATTLATGVGSALVGVCAAITAGRIAEAFSNGWARLNTYSFRNAFFPLFFQLEHVENKKQQHLYSPTYQYDALNPGDPSNDESKDTPSLDAQRTVSQYDWSLTDAGTASDIPLAEHQLESNPSLQNHPQIAYDDLSEELTVNGKTPIYSQVRSLAAKIVGEETDANDNQILTVLLPGYDNGYFNLTFSNDLLIKSTYNLTNENIMTALRSPMKKQ